MRAHLKKIPPIPVTRAVTPSDTADHAARESKMTATNDSEFVFLYSTLPDRSAAEKVGRTLVESKLAACVNVMAPMTSIYEWEGKLDTTEETAVLIKTRRTLVDAAIAAARLLHPYAVPCFLVLPIAGGNEDYLAWARAQTRER